MFSVVCAQSGTFSGTCVYGGMIAAAPPCCYFYLKIALQNIVSELLVGRNVGCNQASSSEICHKLHLKVDVSAYLTQSQDISASVSDFSPSGQMNLF